jgi:hypothetical protein
MGRILDGLERLSRGETLVLPRVVPVRISEYGLTFFHSQPVEESSTGSVLVELPTLPAFEVECDLSVRHCEEWFDESSGGDSSGYAVTGQWVGLEGEMLESLLQYLILRQRELLAFKGRVPPTA